MPAGGNKTVAVPPGIRACQAVNTRNFERTTRNLTVIVTGWAALPKALKVNGLEYCEHVILFEGSAAYLHCCSAVFSWKLNTTAAERHLGSETQEKMVMDLTWIRSVTLGPARRALRG